MGRIRGALQLAGATPLSRNPFRPDVCSGAMSAAPPAGGREEAIGGRRRKRPRTLLRRSRAT